MKKTILFGILLSHLFDYFFCFLIKHFIGLFDNLITILRNLLALYFGIRHIEILPFNLLIIKINFTIVKPKLKQALPESCTIGT